MRKIVVKNIGTITQDLSQWVDLDEKKCLNEWIINLKTNGPNNREEPLFKGFSHTGKKELWLLIEEKHLHLGFEKLREVERVISECINPQEFRQKLGFNDPFKCTRTNPAIQQWKTYADAVIQKHHLDDKADPQTN